MSDWIKHTGAECPVESHARVEVQLNDGRIVVDTAGYFGWQQGSAAYCISAYRTLTRDWVEWAGGECPVPATQDVEIEVRYGARSIVRADGLIWAHGVDLGGPDADIVRYRVVERRKEPIDRAMETMVAEAATVHMRPVSEMAPPYKPNEIFIKGDTLNLTAQSTSAVDFGDLPTAPALLDKARKHMEDRAHTYDKPEGERSMAKTVEAFNVITDRDLTESEGWLLMQILKDVRDRARAAPHVDSLEDGIAYAALKAEARLRGL